MAGGTGQHPKTKATPEEVAASLGDRKVGPPLGRRRGVVAKTLAYRPNEDLSKVRRHP